MNKRILSILVLMFFLILGFSQHQNILIPLSSSSWAPEEPSIYMNPKNTNQLVAGANINNVYCLLPSTVQSHTHGVEIAGLNLRHVYQIVVQDI